MSQKQNPASRRNKPARPAQSMDIRPAKTKSQPQTQFPGVGMTLNTYGNSGGNRPRSSRLNPVPPQSRWQRFKSKFSWKRTFLFLLVIVLLSGGWLGWKVVYNAHKLFGGNVFSALTSSKLKGESAGRVNILLAGNSADDVGHAGGNLTDSIMILSVDTKNNTAFMMSIPRDLYVKIPGAGYQKINAAFPTGERQKFSEDGYADGGMGLLQKIIKQDLGVTTHYYALVNYTALREAVNTVGGVTVDIKSSDSRGLYDSSKDWSTGKPLVKLSNGSQKLNGQQALNLARARGEGRGSYGYGNSDFTRTEYQRKIILALRSKATSAGVLTNPVKLGSLFDSLGKNVETDMNLGNVRRLYEVTKSVNANSIQSVGLNDADGKNLLKSYRTPRGESALIPDAGLNDYSDIRAYLKRLMTSDLVVREGATVVILNGTATSGLAARESDLLEKKNIKVDTVGDADSENYTTTQIINLSEGKKPGTLKALQKAYPGSTATTTNPYGTKYDADFIIVLGTDRTTTADSSSN